AAPLESLAQRLGQGIPGRGGAGKFGIPQAQTEQVRDFERIEHRPAWRPRCVAHIAVPVFASAADPDRLAAFGDVGDHDDLRAARYAPPFAEDVEFDLAKAAREGDLLWRCDALATKEDDAILVV